MAFKIKDKKEIKKIEDNISKRKNEVNETLISANSSLESLKTNMSGYGVKENLSTLQNAISKNGENINDLLERILMLINTKTENYTEEELALAEMLRKAQEELNNITF